MSLLTSILGAVMGGQQQQNPLLQIAMSLLANQGGQGAQAGGAGGLGGLGGLAGLMGAFQKNGMGNVMDSWIGQGQNMPISGDQLQQILGSGQIGQIAQQLGLSNEQASGQLAGLLPELINHMTPSGQAPAEGFGNADQMMDLLKGFMQK